MLIPRSMLFLSTLGVALCLYVYSHGLAFTFPNIDFMNYWTAPHFALRDASLLIDIERYYAAQQAAIGGMFGKNIWSYPPHLLPLLWPLGLLPIVPAQLAWAVLGIACYAWVARTGFTSWRPLVGTLLLALAPASIFNLGQNGFFTAACFLGALWLLDKRPVVAGILLGLLTVKPQLGLVWPLVLLSLGCWRTIASAIVTSLLLGLLSLGLYGLEVWQGFLDFTLPRQWEFITEPYLPRGYQTVLLSLPNALQSLGVPIRVGLSLHYAVALFVVLACAVAVRRCTDFRLRALLLTTGSLLVTPYALCYDMVALSAVLLWCLQRPEAWPTPARIVFMACYLLPALIAPLMLLGLPIAPPLLLALFIIALRAALASARAEAQSIPSPA
jgi:hypothetical protein